MQLYVGRRISSAYSFCCIFPSFRVSRSLSRPFKALLALRSRLLPYKAAALCSQSLTRNTDGPNEAQIVDYRLPGRGGQDGPSRCPLLKPFRRNPACLFLSCATHPSFPPFSFPSLSSASQPVMWLPSIHAVWQHPVVLLSQSIAEFMFYAPNDWKWTAHHHWLGFDISSCSLYFFSNSKNTICPPSFLQLSGWLSTNAVLTRGKEKILFSPTFAFSASVIRGLVFPSFCLSGFHLFAL